MNPEQKDGTSGSPNRIPEWQVILLLIVFPPLAFYFMYKDKRYHAWLPVLLSFVGFLTAFFVLIQIFVVIPRLSVLYKEFGTAEISGIAVLINYILLGSGLLQFVYGIFIMKRLKTGRIPEILLLGVIILLIVNYIFCGYLFAKSFLSVIKPIYNLNSGLEQKTPNQSPGAFTSPGQDSYEKYLLAGDKIIKKENSHESILFDKVSNISEVRLGPDKKSLHFKIINKEVNTPLCANLATEIVPARVNFGQDPPPSAPPWDFSKIGYANTIAACITHNSGGYLINSDYFVYLRLTSADNGLLFIENLKNGMVQEVTVESNLLSGFNDGKNFFTGEETDRGNSYWINPIMGEDGYEYFYPQEDAFLQDKYHVFAFGTLILATDTQTDKFIGGFVQEDVVSYSFWFQSHKDFPFLAVENAWEGPGNFNEIVDLSDGSIKIIKLSDFDKRPWLDLGVNTFEWVNDGIVFNFAEFEEAEDKLPERFTKDSSRETGGTELDKLNRDAEEYLKNNFEYSEVKCELGYGYYSGCEGLVKVSHYKYSTSSGLVKIE